MFYLVLSKLPTLSMMFLWLFSMVQVICRTVSKYSSSAPFAWMMSVCAVRLSLSSLCSCVGKDVGGEVMGLSRI